MGARSAWVGEEVRGGGPVIELRKALGRLAWRRARGREGWGKGAGYARG